MVGTAVVVSLTRGTDAAAGFIYLLRPRCHRKSFRTASRFPMPTTHEQADFAHAKSFVLCSFQPTKSACSASAEKCLSGVGQPLSSVSGRKRYNTLDFASKIVCQQGAARPYWKPRVKGISPLRIPHILTAGGTKLRNPVWLSCYQKSKTRTDSSQQIRVIPVFRTWIFSSNLQIPMLTLRREQAVIFAGPIKN